MSTSQAINSASKRPRTASRTQQKINDENHAKELAKLARAEKHLAQQKKQLLRQQKQAQDTDGGDEAESQSESDEGYGKVLGGGFTSVISSQGIVQTLGGTKALKKRHLLRDNDTMSDPLEHATRPPLHNRSINGPRQTQSSPAPVTQPPIDDLLDFDNSKDQDTPFMSCAQQPHHHERSSPTHSESEAHAQQSRRRRNRSTPSRSETPEDCPPAKRAKLIPVAPFRNGKGPGKSLKASDYDEGVEKMLLNAMHEFACLIFTANAFPDDETQIKWARAVWKNACDKVDSHYELSHRMIRLITERDSWARGLLKDAAREHFKDYYKFKKGSAHETRQYNLNLRVVLLTDDAFHHKDPEAGTGFAESPVIADILETALFEDSSDYGVRFAKYFNPIPANLLALVFTIIEFLIDEYTTGEKVKTSFREKNNIERFEKHSKRLEEWMKLNKQVTTNIRTKLYKKLMKRAGASHRQPEAISGMTANMREKAQQALDGHTGETDSEVE
ncbi:hypothetical protein JOM56_015658 [Amanita muscaria]